jgi:hypothetical protein
MLHGGDIQGTALWSAFQFASPISVGDSQNCISYDCGSWAGLNSMLGLRWVNFFCLGGKLMAKGLKFKDFFSLEYSCAFEADGL